MPWVNILLIMLAPRDNKYTKSYKYGKVELPPRKVVKKTTKNKYDVWGDDYKYNQHQNKIAQEKDDIHLNMMKN